MQKIILITGGARSGKSSYAEELAKMYGNDVLYVATSIPFDEEMKQRVKKHREQRPSNWETIETYKDMDNSLSGRLTQKSAVLLDCITVMVTNLMFEICSDFDEITTKQAVCFEEYVMAEMKKLIDLAKKADVPFILVTNEIGMGIVPENASTRLFRDVAGRTNQMLAKSADEVYLCLSGIPVKIK